LVDRALEAIAQAGRHDVTVEFIKRRLCVSLRSAEAIVAAMVARQMLGPRERAGHRILSRPATTSSGAHDPVTAPEPQETAESLVATARSLKEREARSPAAVATPLTPETVAIAVPATPPQAQTSIDVAVDRLETDAGAQIRERLNQRTVADYEAMMRGGTSFPPLLVIRRAEQQVVIDGHHRLAAARRAGLPTIAVQVVDADPREAMLMALAANGRHGLPLTSADRRKVALRMLADPEWGDWSDSEIARRCGASAMSVGRWRRLGRRATPTPARRTRKYRDGRGTERTMNTTELGRKGRGAKARAPRNAAGEPAPTGEATPQGNDSTDGGPDRATSETRRSVDEPTNGVHCAARAASEAASSEVTQIATTLLAAAERLLDDPVVTRAHLAASASTYANAGATLRRVTELIEAAISTVAPTATALAA
jgi:hypothetical protein